MRNLPAAQVKCVTTTTTSTTQKGTYVNSPAFYRKHAELDMSYAV